MQKLPTIKVRRLRHPAVGVRGPLVAVTVPGQGNKALGFLMQVLGDAIARLPDNIRVENTFFDFEPTATSAEIIVTGQDLTVDQVADDTIDAATAAARFHSQHHNMHFTGIMTHAVQVLR